MKVEILQENFIKVLGHLSKVIPSKPTLPILSHILLVAEDNLITIIGSDSQTTLVTKLTGKVVTPGRQIVPFRTFYEIISALTDKITLESSGAVLQIESGSYKGKINSVGESEYPDIVPKSTPNSTWQLTKATLVALARQTTFAAALDESRASLTGVLFKSVDQSLVCVSTDGFRLSSVTVDSVNKTKEDESLIIPAKSISEIVRLLTLDEDSAKSGDLVKLSLLPNGQINFSFNDIEIYSSLISGKFPDFEKIIPSTNKLKAIFSTTEFLKAVKLSSVFARDNANIVRLKFNPENSTCDMFSQGRESGENVISLTVNYITLPPEELTVAFNYRYLLDFIGSVGECDEISIELSESTSAGVFKDIANPDYLHIIMPVRVQS